MKKTILLLFTCFIYTYSFAQLEKGNWLVGGGGSFSSAKYRSTTTNYNITKLNLSPVAGYFFTNKLAGGLKPIYTSQLTADNSEFSNNSDVKELGVTAFFQYYLLNKAEPFNLFTQLGYGYLLTKASNTNGEDSRNSFEISGGPVYFINQTIGINLCLGYSIYDQNNIEAKGKRFSTGIGFQIHLTKN